MKKSLGYIGIISMMFTTSSFHYSPTSVEIIQFKDVKVFCVYPINPKPIYIIRTNTEWNAISKDRHQGKSCIVDKIDFEKYTLIGSSTLCHGSEAPLINKKVSLDVAAKRLYFDVEIQEQGESSHNEHITSYWVVIPKLSTEIDVISNIKHTVVQHDE